MIRISLTDVNEAPTAVMLANTTAGIAKNTPTVSHVNLADTIVTDDALGTNRLTQRPRDRASAVLTKITAGAIRRAVIAAALIGGLTGSSVATTIVGIVAADGVVIAADSYGTFIGVQPQSPTVCKIFRVGNMLFAVAGIANDAETKYNAAGIISQVIDENRSPAANLQIVEGRMKRALVDEGRALLERDAERFRKKLEDEEALSVVFAQLDRNTPVASHLRVQLEIYGNNLRAQTKAEVATGPVRWVFGQRKVIDREGQKLTRIAKAEELAEALIRLEINAGTLGVGAPIDVVALLRQGPVSISNRRFCPERLR